jgi:hypothetical protein
MIVDAVTIPIIAPLDKPDPESDPESDNIFLVHAFVVTRIRF